MDRFDDFMDFDETSLLKNETKTKGSETLDTLAEKRAKHFLAQQIQAIFSPFINNLPYFKYIQKDILDTISSTTLNKTKEIMLSFLNDIIKRPRFFLTKNVVKNDTFRQALRDVVTLLEIEGDFLQVENASNLLTSIMLNPTERCVAHTPEAQYEKYYSLIQDQRQKLQECFSSILIPQEGMSQQDFSRWIAGFQETASKEITNILSNLPKDVARFIQKYTFCAGGLFRSKALFMEPKDMDCFFYDTKIRDIWLHDFVDDFNRDFYTMLKQYNCRESEYFSKLLRIKKSVLPNSTSVLLDLPFFPCFSIDDLEPLRKTIQAELNQKNNENLLLVAKKKCGELMEKSSLKEFFPYDDKDKIVQRSFNAKNWIIYFMHLCVDADNDPQKINEINEKKMLPLLNLDRSKFGFIPDLLTVGFCFFKCMQKRNIDYISKNSIMLSPNVNLCFSKAGEINKVLSTFDLNISKCAYEFGSQNFHFTQEWVDGILTNVLDVDLTKLESLKPNDPSRIQDLYLRLSRICRFGVCAEQCIDNAFFRHLVSPTTIEKLIKLVVETANSDLEGIETDFLKSEHIVSYFKGIEEEVSKYNNENLKYNQFLNSNTIQKFGFNMES